jgi:S-adenosylmethionine synthetase
VPQDPHLARNQEGSPHVGDNGIAKGMPVTAEQRELTALIRTLDENFHSDAKAVLTPDRLIVCQSNASYDEVFQCIAEFVRHNGYGKTIIGGMTPAQITINPLGPWTGGLDADSGATNRKLGSDMGDALTGGGLAGKDLSKADVSCQIVAHMLAQQYHTEVRAAYAIGDEQVTYHIGGHGEHQPDTQPDAPDLTLPFSDIIERARLYVFTQFGSFEKFAEYGLIA